MQALTENVAEIQLTYRPTCRLGPVISSSHEAYEELLKWFPEETISLQERFVALYLNRANRVLGAYLASSGGITGTIADPRLIMTVALKSAAVSIILSHNHPSGNLKASAADIQLTKKIQEAGQLLDIQVVDHLILSYDGYYSFADEGNL
jgi:DNA repair protein RadC